MASHSRRGASRCPRVVWCRKIDRLAEDFDGRVQLAVSLHALTDEERSAIMPINRKHNLADLMACLRRYPLAKRRRITIEYTLIADINDSLEHAEKMARLLRGIPVKVNLIPLNPIADATLQAPSMTAVDRFSEPIGSARPNRYDSPAAGLRCRCRLWPARAEGREPQNDCRSANSYRRAHLK